jgi:ferredoxin
VYVSADTDLCVGAGQCVLAAPDVFGQNDDGHVVPLLTRPAPEFWADVHEAAALCPARAISVHDH